MNHSIRTLLLPLAVALAATTVRADFLDGQVVNSLGQGVPGININVYTPGSGNQPPIFNDGTDANGFFHTTVPAGTWDIEFRPPQPPGSNGLITLLPSVQVAGTTNLGVVTLVPGAALSGRVVNSLGQGVAGINFDVLDASGANVPLLYDATDALGNFSFASPLGAVRVRLDTTTVVGQTLAPLELALDLTGDQNLGTLTLPQGYIVTAILHRPNGQAINGCDLDCYDEATGVKLFTPSDNTNSSGLVDTIVPAGTFHFDFCPPVNLSLCCGRVGPTTIGSNVFLGIVTLSAGVTLSGTVDGADGSHVGNVHIRVRDQSSGADVPVCDNNTGGNGQYSIFVPNGTFAVDFRPTAAPWGRTITPNVLVSGNTSLDAALPYLFTGYCFGDGSLATACPCGNFGTTGRGCQNSAGTGGAQLSASGWYLPDSVVLTQSGELASALSIFLQGTGTNANGVVFGDGLRCTAGSLKRLMTRNASGGVVSYPQAGDLGIQARSAQLGDVIAAGTARYYQVYYRDPNLAFCPNPPGNSWNVGNAIQVNW